MDGGGGGAGAFRSATGRDVDSGEDKPRYHAYQYELIAPHVGRSVLEVGAGGGDFAALFAGRDRVVATDVDPDAVKHMDQRFADQPEFSTRQLDLDTGPFVGEPVATVVAINVLEHFDNDGDILRSTAQLVEPGGNIVLWVPGYQQLYGDFDRKVGHFRRYTPDTLRSAIQRAGLTPEVCKPVNLLGGIAWWAAVRRGGTGSPNPRLVSVYDRVVVPVSSFLDRYVRVPFGQSILGVARVPG